MTSLIPKYIETVWLFYGFILVGIDNGILGPVLLDLQILVSVDMAEISDLFIVTGVGFIIGCLLALLIETVMNMRLLLAISLIAGSLVNIALPLTTSLTYLIVMSLVQGILKGFVDYAILAVCRIIWESSKGLAFQFVSLAAAIGSFVAPFVVKPFLAKREDITHSCVTGTTVCMNSTVNATQVEDLTPSDIQVYKAYFILGSVTLPPAFAFLYYYFRNKATEVPYTEFDKSGLFAVNSNRSMIFLVLLIFYHIPVFGYLLAYGDLLLPFGVLSDLNMSKQTMATMTSLFWGAFVIGRAVNIVLSRVISTFTVLLVNCCGQLAAVIYLYLKAEDNSEALWVGSIILGGSSAVFLPGVLAWSDQYLPVTGCSISSCLVASGLGEILFPFIGGKLFTSAGPGSLMLLMLITVVIKFAMFILLILVGEAVKNESEPTNSQTEDERNPKDK